MIRKIVLNICLFLMAKLAIATVSASVDRTTIELGQTITLTIKLNGSSDIPNLDKLNENFVIYGTSSSSQISIVNGNSSSSYSYIITLSPKNIGKQIIPTLTVGNDMTNPIPIEVIQGIQKSHDKYSKDKIYLDVFTEKKPYLYVGVPVLLRLKLYYSIPINNIRVEPINIPNAKLQIQGKVIQYRDNDSGNKYLVAEQKYLLIPESVGVLTVPPIKISGMAFPNNLQNILAMMNSQSFQVNSKPLTFNIKPFPSGVDPDNWLPATKLNITESWIQESDPLVIGNLITRNITIEAGSILSSTMPDITFIKPNGVNAYPEKPINDELIKDNKLLATKKIKIVYVPTQDGVVEFPETKIKWWDLASNKLKIAVIPAKTFNIRGDKKIAINANKRNITTNLGNSIGIVKYKGFKHIAYYLILGLFALLSILIFLSYILLIRNKKAKSQNEKIALSLVFKACKNKDLKNTNSALVNWANYHWKKNIYSISEIKDLSNNSNLNQLIEKLNLALYKGEVFNEFESLMVEINLLTKIKYRKEKSVLKSFYPN